VEPSDDRTGVHAALDQFDRDAISILVIGSDRQVNQTYPALTELLKGLI
jgi:hypothetical protein